MNDSLNNFGNITAGGMVYRAPARPPAANFWIDPKGHENFWCPVTGGTSGSSSSPRCEARETEPGTSVSHNWDPMTGQHMLSGDVRVELVPSSGKVIVAQIHAHGAPNPFVMVTWWDGVIRIDMRSQADGDAANVIKIPCPLSKLAKFSLEVREGYFGFNLLGETRGVVPVDPSWKPYPFYFKRGAYVIDHEGPETEGGWVVYERSYLGHIEG